MLPKVATTILHSTSRAAAAVTHNQSHTIRNVLQLQSSSPSSGPSKNGTGSSNSGWGPSSGGTTHNTGSRFQSGYHGASRAVSQAQVVTSNDGGVSQTDDYDEVQPKRLPTIQSPSRTRLRSGSTPLTLAGASEHSEKAGVLQTVQRHRARHAFASAAEPESASSPAPVLSRSSSTLLQTNSGDPDLPPPSPRLASRPSTPSLSTSPAAPQTALPRQPDEDDPHSEDYRRLIAARDSKDANLVAEAVAHLRSVNRSPLVPEFNAALEALYATRGSGEPLTVILETYNDMLSRGLLPNFRTYHLLLKVLTDRDYEVDWAIKGMEARRKWRNHIGIKDATEATETEKLEKFRAETNFVSAMSVFQAIVSLNGIDRINDATLSNLLRSCTIHDNVDSAILVWSQIEKRKEYLPSSVMFKNLIQVFSHAGDVKAAEEIFKDFRKRSLRGKIAWEGQQAGSAHLALYNTMIEAYFNCGLPDMSIALLDEMIDTSTSASTPIPDSEATTPPISRFNPTRPPAPASSTFTTIISGFCRMNDTESAVVWFNRLLKQKYRAPQPFLSTALPTRPDLIAWRVIIEHLSTNGKVDELNDLVSSFNERNLQETDNIELRALEKHFIQRANLNKVYDLIASNSPETGANAKVYLDFLSTQKILVPASRHDLAVCQEVAAAYVALGYSEEALQHFEAYCDALIAERKDGQSHTVLPHFVSLRQKLYQKHHRVPPFTVALSTARLAARFSAPSNSEASVGLLQAYALAKEASSLPSGMSLDDWTVLLTNAADVEILDPATVQSHIPEYAFSGLLSLLEDLPRDLSFSNMPIDSAIKVVKNAVLVHGLDSIMVLLASNKVDPSFLAVLNSQQATNNLPPPRKSSTSSSPASDSSAASSPSIASTAPTSVSASSEAARVYEAPRYFVDPKLTKSMEDIIHRVVARPDSSNCNGLKKMFFDHLRKRQIPSAFIISKMIATLGRGGDIDGAKRVYTKMQDILATMVDQPKEQAETWFLIEDSMIVALAQAGDIDGAHVHRLRVLEQGGAPSADAYGGLILGVRDTTDDTSNAMALFQESQMHSVQPNQYLYNNIISKLAKARKADQALELFHTMRQNGVQPSSITYGALIGACARVGDVESAESLFGEMIQQDNFKPRVPPYNTMMQLYTTTKPNRERSLFYYNQLLAAGVKPTPYTFKLLMETYVLEPINIVQVETVFNTIVKNPKVELQSTHFATLINAYGCILKDLDKAISVFDSIHTYPRAPPMDALIVESMINVIVAHRRMDLLPDFIAKMNFAGVHMTAYIVNAMIRGHAVTGDLEQAREIFESLVDPPTGVAGLHNHAPHDPSLAVPISPMAPVYREPSTWEAMVRAELGAGHRDLANALLERLKARQYPEAVFNRISGILVDHSMIPMI